jgi:hypothetical protein
MVAPLLQVVQENWRFAAFRDDDAPAALFLSGAFQDRLNCLLTTEFCRLRGAEIAIKMGSAGR